VADAHVVVVLWRDAFYDYEVRDGMRAEFLVRTVGYLIDGDGPFVHLASEILPEGDGYRGVTHVPTHAIHALMVLA
jgi:hypothetical protein